MLANILSEPALQNIDIVIKCKKYPQFYKQLSKIQKNYVLDLKLALSAKSQKKALPFDFIQRKKLFINFYAFKMNAYHEEDFKELYLNWIQMMNAQFKKHPQQRYSIIYFHNLSHSLKPYLFLKDIFKKLPIQYYAFLDKIYVVQSSLLMNGASVFEFGRLHKLYYRRIHFLQKYLIEQNSLNQLEKIEQIKQNQIMKTIPSVITLDESTELTPHIVESEKEDCLSINLQNHILSSHNIPIYLQILVDAIGNHPQILKLEGIFRKSGSIEEQGQLIKELSQLRKFQQKEYSGYAVAGVIKKFFRKLKEPIIPYQIYNRIMQEKQDDQKIWDSITKQILKSLPAFNRSILLFTMRFLKQYVAKYEKYNKMSTNNLSIVFYPCFFRPQNETLEDLLNSYKFVGILNRIFNQIQSWDEQSQGRKRGSTVDSLNHNKEKRGQY